MMTTADDRNWRDLPAAQMAAEEAGREPAR
jgi:hypothetical protein